MAANIRETSIAFGFKKQNAIAVANVLAGIWKLSKVNPTLASVKPIFESDAQDIGKGHEWETQAFASHWDVSGSIEKYATSDFAAWAFGFALGDVAKSGASPNLTYTITPLDPVTDGIELPVFSYLEAVRQGGSPSTAILDRMLVGCAVNELIYTISSGVGRANHKITANFIGTGKQTTPSAITHPAITAEKGLPQASATVSINGVDYITVPNFVSAEIRFRNNIRVESGFFPGSGTQNGLAIMGRMEYGDREASMTFVARFDENSTELADLLAQTDGTAVITTTYDANNNLSITFEQVVFRVAEVANENGLVTVQVECGIQFHASNGLMTVVADCNTDNIMTEEP